MINLCFQTLELFSPLYLIQITWHVTFLKTNFTISPLQKYYGGMFWKHLKVTI
jgi:hypothetical protein